MFKKLLLFTGLFGALLGSCRQEDANRLADDATTPAGPGVELLLDFGADQLRETPTSPAEAQAQAGRAFDYVVYDETAGGTTKTAPHLDPTAVTGDVTATVILRSTDSQQPITITTITMEPRTAYPDGSAVPSDRLYLHTKKSGATITAKPNTDFTKGTWSMSLIVGGTLSREELYVDPNNLESVTYSSDAESDRGIDLFSARNKWNLKGITKATKGSSYTDAERATLDVPYISEWMTLEDGNYVDKGDGNPPTLSFGSRRFALRPQGTLLRLEIKNENFDPIKLAGMRILTNMMTFRGSYDLSEESIRSSQDLAATWTGLRADGRAVIDSAAAYYGWSLPFPNYADFWLKDKEDIATGAKSSKYYLIWAMPQTVAATNAAGNLGRTTEQSRGGVMHVLLYDANRTGEQYNRRNNAGGTVLPKALIRKPLLTRNFPAGAFRLSSSIRGGQSIRLVGAQTKIYTFLHYLKTADEGSYRSYAEMQNMTVAGDDALPDINYWASIFPGKLPDNPGKPVGTTFEYKHYIYSNDTDPWSPRLFSTSKYGKVTVPGGDNLENFPVILSGKEDYERRGANATDKSKSGQAHNIAAIRIPAEMQIPYIVGDTKKPLLYKTDEANEGLYFSTSNVNVGNKGQSPGYMMVGWGEGQQFLTAYAYHFNTATQKLEVYSRYMGPAFHRPYTGSFADSYAWDMSWLPWYNYNSQNSGRPDGGYFEYEPEVDDAKRELTLGGYKYNGHRQNNTGVTGSQNSLFYWIRSTEAEPQWLYYYGANIQNNRGPMGVGTAMKANRASFNATEQGKLEAYIRLFSKKPIAN